jgi:C4-dicarboxylate-specific signal transduction histidine kinase
MAAPFFQITLGFFYFLKQSVKFEAESNENLRKLEIEHSKQIQVQKMSSLGEMAGGVAHEINNPLMVIVGTTYNLKKTLASKLSHDDPTFAKIEKIDSMVYRIVGIIKALKNISRNSENDPAERTSVHSVINSTLDLCRERFSKHGILLEILGDETLEINCRPTEISQVLLNLLNNAFDATLSREGARVSIRTQKIANKVEISIEDNGHGIPITILDKIMQPFFSTKEIGQGTGLGLSISKGLIESHKGTLTCIPGDGKTTFQIHLPQVAN